MKIWSYHPVTGELLGQITADPNPLEEGAWLIPAHATTISPGDAQLGRAYQFTGAAWANVADCRGETWWKIGAEFNTEPVAIDFIGDPSHRGLTNVEPQTPPADVPLVSATALQLFKALAAGVGKTQAEIEALIEVAKTL